MQRFAPFLLDRLIDASPDSRSEAAQPMLTLEQLKATVARDVEALLNTRCSVRESALSDFEHASHSIVRFGIDDFSSYSLSSVSDRDHICRSIARALADHEPRLRNAQVEIDANEALGAGVRFNINAVLHIHPMAEPVSFDAVLQTGTQNYRVATSARSAAPQR